MKGYEPGDADWGVQLDDVRGQAEPKEEVTRVIELWQSGEEFRKAGGKPERGLLFIGAPGTGKTMLSKGIATSFNSPIVTMPGSGFAQTFIGMDVVIVMFLIRKARKLARKWGGQCIIFIDEIDAVGLRRQALPAPWPAAASSRCRRAARATARSTGRGARHGHRRPDPRDARVARAGSSPPRARRAPVLPPALARIYGRDQRLHLPRRHGRHGRRHGAQPAARPDGRRRRAAVLAQVLHEPHQHVPRRHLHRAAQDAGRSLRLPAPKPRPEQIYFIGATNVPIDRLDPALIRPGRMGRHIWFRTPTKDDRKDIFDLYLGKVAHEPDLDTPARATSWRASPTATRRR